MYQVAEIAQAAGVSANSVRYYTRIGLLQPVQNPGNRYRLYTPKDLCRIRFIKQAQNLGFSLAEIREILDDAELGESPCPRVREFIRVRIEENRRKIDEMADLQIRMEAALRLWETMPDRAPDGESVCHLIESVAEYVAEREHAEKDDAGQ